MKLKIEVAKEDIEPSAGHLGGWKILNAPPGTCQECATVHEPGQAHNQQSLHYQYTFYDKHGRWPTWADAMAHCTPEVQARWKDGLKEHGVVVPE